MLGAKGDEKASSESIYEFSVLCHFEVPSTLYYNIGVIYECRNNWNYVALKMLQRKKQEITSMLGILSTNQITCLLLLF